MAICYICGKKKQYGHNVSHSKRRTKRVFKPNVYRKRMKVDGEIKRVKICSKCLKRAKNFGKVKAKKETVLAGAVISVVDWAKWAEEKKKMKKKVGKVEAKKKKAVDKKEKGAEKTEKKAKKKKAEVSIEDIVGKKKK